MKATYAYVQWPPSGATTVDGQWELSTWAETAALTIEVSQVVTRLVVDSARSRDSQTSRPESGSV